MFPWIVEIFELSSYHFYKVIEIIVREEDGLSRDVVKHLNHVSTVKSLLQAHALIEAHSPVWTPKMPIFKQISQKVVPLIKANPRILKKNRP